MAYSRKRPGGPGSVPAALSDPDFRYSPTAATSQLPGSDPLFAPDGDDLGDYGLKNTDLNQLTPASGDPGNAYPQLNYTTSGPNPLPQSQEVALRRTQQSPYPQYSIPNGGQIRYRPNGNYPRDFQLSGVDTKDPKLITEAEHGKRDPASKRKQIPPFVQKLSSFLNKYENTDLIRWSDDGDSFIVLDEDEFARKLIPELFKHNNYASFVRQLNMYGFHKKVGLSDNSMRSSERKTKNPSEYSNPFFKRDRPDLLWKIQKPKTATRPPSRKIKNENGSDDDGLEDYGDENLAGTPGNPRSFGRAQASNQTIAKILAELEELSQNQRVVAERLNRIEQDNAILKDQAFAVTSTHLKHENSINNLILFLASFFRLKLGDSPQLQQLYGNILRSDSMPQNIVEEVDGPANLPLSRRPTNQRLLEYNNEGVAGSNSGRVQMASPAYTIHDEFDEPNPGSRISRPVMGRRGSGHSSMAPIKNEATTSNSDFSIPWSDSAAAQKLLTSGLEAHASASHIPTEQEVQQFNALAPEVQSKFWDIVSSAASPPSSQSQLASGPSRALASPGISEQQFLKSEDDIAELRKLIAENEDRVNNVHGMARSLTPNGEGVPSMGGNGDQFSDEEFNELFGRDAYFSNTNSDVPLFGDDLGDSAGFDGAVDGLGPLARPDGNLGAVADHNLRVQSLESSAEASRATSVDNAKDGDGSDARRHGGDDSDYQSRARSSSKRRKLG